MFFRLKSKTVIKKIFAKGTFLKSNIFSVKYIQGGADLPGVAIIVPKKKIPSAVNRNLIRRRIKHFLYQDSALFRKNFPVGLYLLIYSNSEVISYLEIKKAIVSVFSNIPLNT
tara:strand:+ start:76 stop:414 length:339 start_codon:yes stop_codon:yes gene_type:complete